MRNPAETVAGGRQLGHYAQRGGVTIAGAGRQQVELGAQRDVAEAGVPTLADQVILRLAVARDRNEVRVDAARAGRAEQLDAIGHTEAEHAANVGDVAETFTPVEVDQAEASRPLALWQRLAGRHKPEASVAENSATAGLWILCPHTADGQNTKG
jgi:hypothetical protein